MHIELTEREAEMTRDLLQNTRGSGNKYSDDIRMSVVTKLSDGLREAHQAAAS